MIYSETTHDRVKVGQCWRCHGAENPTLLIVAIDSYPAGYVMNVLVQDGLTINGVSIVQGPIEWEHLAPCLNTLVSEHNDIADCLPSYKGWKQEAQEGRAGFWTTGPAELLKVIRDGVSP